MVCVKTDDILRVPFLSVHSGVCLEAESIGESFSLGMNVNCSNKKNIQSAGMNKI